MISSSIVKFGKSIWPMWINSYTYHLSKKYFSKSKCSFGAFEVEYLGHIVGKDGVRVDPNKIEAMKDRRHPKTSLKILRGFLG
jgi:hypothetical protein